MHPVRTLQPLVLASLVALCVPAAQAQILPRQAQTFGDLMGFDLNPLQSMSRFSRMGELVPMEGPVDASSYVVGPGDLFDISVGGARPVVASIAVSADGYLLLPEAGAIEVAGLPLEQARRTARQALEREFQNVNTEVTLSQPRQFYVHVSGAIPTPGRYVATPVARVSTIIYMAFADTTRPPVSNPNLRPSLRNVKLIHRDGSSERVDLLRYFATGNPAHNPYLTDGDIISVPTYDPNRDAVFISGDVAFPGTYDYRPDDTVYDLLVLATGQDPPTGFKQVRVLSSGPDGGTSSEIFDMASLDRTTSVSPLDQIHAVEDPLVRGSATVEGWVHYPGTYSIVPGSTSLGDLLEMAGGVREGALERGAYLMRATLPTPEPVAVGRNRFEPNSSGFRMIRSDTLALLQSVRLAPADFLSRAYLAHEIRLQNQVPVDLRAMEATESILLQDRDRVYVPRDENSVFVVGQVNRPGYVSYRPNAPLSYYIEASGGFSDNAGRAFVVEAGTGRYLNAGRADILSGDMIFVDRARNQADTAEMQRLLLEERRARLEERSRTVQSIVQSISAATAIITTYLLVRRELN